MWPALPRGTDRTRSQIPRAHLLRRSFTGRTHQFFHTGLRNKINNTAHTYTFYTYHINKLHNENRDTEAPSKFHVRTKKRVFFEASHFTLACRALTSKALPKSTTVKATCVHTRVCTLHLCIHTDVQCTQL